MIASENEISDYFIVEELIDENMVEEDDAYYDLPQPPEANNLKSKKENKRLKHDVKQSCNTETCFRKCNSMFSMERRMEINNGFWQLDNMGQKLFVKSMTSVDSDVKRRRSKNSTRQTLKYSLKDDKGTIKPGCLLFFCSTLGFNKGNNTFIRYVVGRSNDEVPKDDMRGRHANKSKSDETVIVQHIESFGPTISHYRRTHAPERRYLPSDVSIQKMHSMFNEAYPKKYLFVFCIQKSGW